MDQKVQAAELDKAAAVLAQATNISSPSKSDPLFLDLLSNKASTNESPASIAFSSGNEDKEGAPTILYVALVGLVVGVLSVFGFMVYTRTTSRKMECTDEDLPSFMELCSNTNSNVMTSATMDPDSMNPYANSIKMSSPSGSLSSEYSATDDLQDDYDETSRSRWI